MENEINILEILKNAPKDIKLYSPLFGEVTDIKIGKDKIYPITFNTISNIIGRVTKYGKYYNDYPDSECILFPSKENRNWTTFNTTRYRVGDYVMYDTRIVYHIIDIAENKLIVHKYNKPSKNVSYININNVIKTVEPKDFLAPFDKVLIKNNNSAWEISIYSHYNPDCPYPFITINGTSQNCIPFYGNEHLLRIKCPECNK